MRDIVPRIERTMWFWIPLCILLTQVPPPDSADPSERLELASQESLQGNHRRVVELLAPMLYPASQFSTEEEELKALRLLGLSYWFLGEYDESTKTFTNLLNRQPDFKLDPVVVPAGAISFFNQIKARLREKLREIERLKQEEEERRKREKEEAERKRLEELRRNAPILHEQTIIQKNYMFFNFLPFGVGQFQNQQDAKGWLFVGLQLLSATVSISAYTYLKYKYPKGTVPADEIVSARQIQYLQVGGGIAFYGLWLTGIVDALIFQKPSRVDVRRRFEPGRRTLELYGAPLESGGFILGIEGVF